MEMKFTGNNFMTEVLQSEVPVLVDFYAEWCGPCKMMGPIVKKLADQYEGRMKIGKLNIDESAEIADSYKVMSVPTFIFFKNGEVILKQVGSLPEKELQAKIEEVLAK